MRSATLLLLTSLIAITFFPASPSYAEERPIDCQDIRNTVESNFCAEKDFDAADAKLNALYKKVLAQIAETDLEKPYDRSSWDTAMREAQRAWVTFRDADCKGAVPMEWSGGSGTSAAVLGCMTEKTETRTRELKERYGIE
jgi:uncharacterized protein YecT (DUF1311 family)